MSIKHNNQNPDLSLVECDACGALYCMVQDLTDDAEKMLVGLRLDSVEGIFYFCSKACLKKFLGD